MISLNEARCKNSVNVTGIRIHNLLPGVYKVEIQVAGHSDIIREVRLGSSDVTLEVTLR